MKQRKQLTILLLLSILLVLLVVNYFVPVKSKTIIGCPIHPLKERYSIVFGQSKQYEDFNDITGDEAIDCAHVNHKIRLHIF